LRSRPSVVATRSLRSTRPVPQASTGVMVRTHPGWLRHPATGPTAARAEHRDALRTPTALGQGAPGLTRGDPAARLRGDIHEPGQRAAPREPTAPQRPGCRGGTARSWRVGRARARRSGADGRRRTRSRTPGARPVAVSPDAEPGEEGAARPRCRGRGGRRRRLLSAGALAV